MSFSADEINYLIWRYLLENEFEHTAYVLTVEASVKAKNMERFARQVPNGALVNLIQKGIYYSDAELSRRGEEVVGRVGLLEACRMLSGDIPDFRGSGDVAEESEDVKTDVKAPAVSTSSIPVTQALPASTHTQENIARVKRLQKPREQKDAEKEPSSSKPARMHPRHVGKRPFWMVKQPAETEPVVSAPPPAAPKVVVAEVKTKMEVDIPADKIQLLKGHTSEVFSCAWNPMEDILVTGSRDSTGRVWDLRLSNNPLMTPTKMFDSTVMLKHCSNIEGINSPPNKDVTTVDWNVDGTRFATGCYDGFARIWSKEGRLLSTLGIHRGPIFAVRFNPSGDFLLSSGVDKTSIVWDSSTGTMLQQYSVHSASVLDGDWYSNDCFASCSTDTLIFLNRLGSDKPIKVLKGHENEINAVRWDPHVQRLASCSDDRTLKIWSVDQDHCIHSFEDHTMEIYTLRWSPAGTLIATASFDHTVRLWDASKGICRNVLQEHKGPIYSVAFSPDARYLATGCLDGSVYVWDTNGAKVIARFNGDQQTMGGIFEVSWNRTGEKLTASASDGTIILMDLRNLR